MSTVWPAAPIAAVTAPIAAPPGSPPRYIRRRYPHVLTTVAEHLLMQPDGGMQHLPFTIWLRLRLVSRALHTRFRTVAVPAFLGCLRRGITAVMASAPQLAGIRPERCTFGGSLITSHVLGHMSIVAACGGTYFGRLNVYIPVSTLTALPYGHRLQTLARGLRETTECCSTPIGDISITVHAIPDDHANMSVPATARVHNLWVYSGIANGRDRPDHLRERICSTFHSVSGCDNDW